MDAEGVAGRPAHDDVGAGDVAVAAHRHGDELGEGVEFGGEGEEGGGVHVFAAGHRQAHAEEQDAEAGRLHLLHQIDQRFERDADLLDDLLIDALSLDQRPQDAEHFEVLAGADLQEDVGGLGTGGLADVD